VLSVAVLLLLPIVSLHIMGFSEEKIVWQPTNGPSSASVSALVVNAAGHIFLGSSDGGVFRPHGAMASDHVEKEGIDYTRKWMVSCHRSSRIEKIA
jgi:hypothetical protein